MSDAPTEPPSTELAPPEPPVPPVPPRRKPRLRRRWLIIIAAGVALLLVAGSITGVVIAGQVDHQNALNELAAARSDAARAAAALRSAETTHADAATALTADLGAVDASLAAGGGATIDEAAATRFQTARDAVAADYPDLVPVPAPADGTAPPADADDSPPTDADDDADDDAADDAADDDAGVPANASTAEIRALAASARTAASDDTDAAEKLADDTDAVTAASDDLDAASTAFATAAQARGQAILTERADAKDDVKAALQAQLDALPTQSTADLPAALAGFLAAAQAVITSSDEARAPKAPNGSGIIIPDPSSITAVVNKRRALPSNYVPPGLVVPPGIANNNNQPVRQEVVAPLQQMAAAMSAAGIQLRIASAYRSFATQKSVYNGYVAKEGVAGADTHSARPGHSEHQTGLVMDLDDGTGCSISTCFANKPGGQWLAANAWQYGFILRYGNGWQPIVGYTFEPWHYRYVGVDVSTDMHNKGILTLEEYYGLPAAPDYG